VEGLPKGVDRFRRKNEKIKFGTAELRREIPSKRLSTLLERFPKNDEGGREGPKSK